MRDFLKRELISANLSGVMFIICGLVLAIFPGSALKLVCGILGVGLFAAGAFHILGYVLNLMNLDAYHYVRGYRLVYGSALLALGIFCFIGSEFLVSVIPFVLGLGILFSGISKLQQSLDLRKLGFTGWSGMLVTAVVCMVCGSVVLFNPFDSAKVLMIYVGIWLIISGVTDLISNGLLTRRLAQIRKEFGED